MSPSAAKKKPAAHAHAEAAEGSLVDLHRETIERARKVVEKNTALAKLYELLRKVVGATTLVEAKRRYEIGRLVGQVQDDKEKYGRRSVEALATLLGFDKSTLYTYAEVAKTWDAKEFNGWLKKKSEAGIGLRFSHFVVVAQVADGRRRNALLTRALSENLTVRQLELECPSAPASDVVPEEASNRAEDQIRHSASRWEAAADEIYADTRAILRLASTTASRTPEVLRLVKATADKQRALAKKAGECADQLTALASEKSPA